MRGFPEQGRLETEAAVALARDLSHPFSLAFALAFAAFLYRARRDVARTLERADATIAVCAEHGFAMYLAVGTIFRGWAIAEQGEGDAGLAVMEAGLRDYAATGAALVQPYFLALIADACRRWGQADRARGLVDTALAAAERTGERVYEAELHRLAGELIAQEPRATTGAEGRFLEAIRIARRQGALSLELRAATSLARFWQARGRAVEARTLVSDVCSRFTEGFETPDLREATMLLD
jgi:predicted ATPase